MSVIKINAITVPDGKGKELEKRFAQRMHSVDAAPGFMGFKLLRPTKGETRYFVFTEWKTEQDFIDWSNNGSKAAHAGMENKESVATKADLLEFEVVDFTAL